jgi:chromosome segregation ATPase
MNQPTREEFDQLKEEVRKLKEQQTEPIKVTRIEVASEDVLKRLDTIDQKLSEIGNKQDQHANVLIAHARSISALQTDIGTLKGEMAGARADILKIRESQADSRDILKNTATKDDLLSMATKDDLLSMATKDDITHLGGLIQQLLQQRSSEGPS